MGFSKMLGARLVRTHKDGVTVECILHEGLLNTNRVAHGGAIAGIVDEAAWHALDQHFKKSRTSTTTELKVNYLLPLMGKKATARAHLLRAGKTLCVTRVDVKDERRRLAAVAIVTYMLLGERPT